MSIALHGDDAGAGGIAALRHARALVPELDAAQVAQDDYTYWKKHDVIAVFDHDPAMLSLVKRQHLRYLLGSGATLFILGLVVVSVQTSASYSSFVWAFTAIHVWLSLKIWRMRLPRTAVTVDGLVHVDEAGTWPFSEL